MRLIDADAVINAIIELRKELIKCKSYDEYDRAFFQGENDGLIEAENIVKYSLTIEPGQKKGEWVKTIKHYKDDNMEFDFYAIKCSACGEKPEKAYHLTRYCPNCGADLRKEGDENVDNK